MLPSTAAAATPPEKPVRDRGPPGGCRAQIPAAARRQPEQLDKVPSAAAPAWKRPPRTPAEAAVSVAPRVYRELASLIFSHETLTLSTQNKVTNRRARLSKVQSLRHAEE